MISVSNQVASEAARSLQPQPRQENEAKQPVASSQKEAATDVSVELTQKKVAAASKAEEAGPEEQRSKGNGFLSRFASGVQSAWNSVTETVSSAVSVAKEVVDKVKDTASNVVSTVREGVSSARESVSDLKDRASDLKDTALAMKDNAVSLVSEGVSAAVSVGKGVLQGGAKIASGVVSIGQAFSSGKSLGQRFASVAQGVDQFRQAADPIRNSFQQFGEAREGFSAGLSALQENRDQFKSQWSEASQSFADVRSEVASTWNAVKDDIGQGVSDISALVSGDANQRSPLHVMV